MDAFLKSPPDPYKLFLFVIINNTKGKNKKKHMAPKNRSANRKNWVGDRIIFFSLISQAVKRNLTWLIRWR